MSHPDSTAVSLFAFDSSSSLVRTRPADSITCLLDSLRSGSEEAVCRLWDLYFSRLVGLVRKQLGQTCSVDRDEEDLALSAFKSIFSGVKKERISHDMDRESLWKFMATVTLRKVYDFIAYRRRQKRCPDRSTGARSIPLDDSEIRNALISNELSGELKLEFDEYFKKLLSMLPKQELRQIVAFKLEGFSNQEIASRLGRGLSSIERKLKTIRTIWEQEFNQ